MQSNPMKAALADGKVQIGTWLNLMRNPAILTLMKGAGMDYARVDMEHSSPSMETVADMAVLGRAIGLPIVVRPPEGNREWITRLLDCGVWGLHIPQVDNPAIAKAVVEASRYRPIGTRGQAGFAPGTDFDRAGNTPAGRKHLNEQVHITVMFESAEAFTHIDEIVSMEGIDAVTLGPSDLAQELGVMGTPDQAKVIDEHRFRLIEAANKYGKDVAMLVPTLEEAERWIAAGVKIIAYSSDVDILAKGFEEAAARLKK
ncbi:MAG: HpcH/HpaI aldolase/citrate lyase family protein [Chloroflexota bacterium]